MIPSGSGGSRRWRGREGRRADRRRADLLDQPRPHPRVLRIGDAEELAACCRHRRLLSQGPGRAADARRGPGAGAALRRCGRGSRAAVSPSCTATAPSAWRHWSTSRGRRAGFERRAHRLADRCRGGPRSRRPCRAPCATWRPPAWTSSGSIWRRRPTVAERTSAELALARRDCPAGLPARVRRARTTATSCRAGWSRPHNGCLPRSAVRSCSSAVLEEVTAGARRDGLSDHRHPRLAVHRLSGRPQCDRRPSAGATVSDETDRATSWATTASRRRRPLDAVGGGHRAIARPQARQARRSLVPI